METAYFGIWIEEQDGEFWIVDANGGEHSIGNDYPTKEQVTEYRNLIKGGF